MNNELHNEPNMLDYNIEEERTFIQELSAVTLGMESPNRYPTLSPEPQEDTTMREPSEVQAGAAHKAFSPSSTTAEEVEAIMRQALEDSGTPEGWHREQALRSLRIPRIAPAPLPPSPEFIPRTPDHLRYPSAPTPVIDLTEETPVIDLTNDTPELETHRRTPAQHQGRNTPQRQGTNNRPQHQFQRYNNRPNPMPSLDALLASTLTRLAHTPGGEQALRQAQAQYQAHRPRGRRGGKKVQAMKSNTA
ncbi:hypothetical protein JCM5296_006188, partial [Sporobolomyces johnsonii]